MTSENWRSSADYDYTACLDPEELAWEFLRRNPAYQRDYALAGTDEAAADEAAHRWGLRFPGGSGAAGGSGRRLLAA